MVDPARIWAWIRGRAGRVTAPHLTRGRIGEDAAARHLRRHGYRVLARNFHGPHGELDLVARGPDGLVFVEVKTRSTGQRTRPADAVRREKRRRITRTALLYLERIGRPRIAFRFDIVEVLVEGTGIVAVNHIEDAFPMDPRYRYL